MGGCGGHGDCRDGCGHKELDRLHSVFDLKGSVGNDKDEYLFDLVFEVVTKWVHLIMGYSE